MHSVCNYVDQHMMQVAVGRSCGTFGQEQGHTKLCLHTNLFFLHCLADPQRVKKQMAYQDITACMYAGVSTRVHEVERQDKNILTKLTNLK